MEIILKDVRLGGRELQRTAVITKHRGAFGAAVFWGETRPAIFERPERDGVRQEQISSRKLCGSKIAGLVELFGTINTPSLPYRLRRTMLLSVPEYR